MSLSPRSVFLSPCLRILWLVCCMPLISACVSREQADSRLAAGCTAATLVFAKEGVKVEQVGNRIFGKSDLGSDMRHVILNVTESDGWFEEPKEYRCIFQEQFGLFGMGYTAFLHQVRIGDDIYGKDENNQIIGSAHDHLKLTEAVARAMR